MLEIKTQAMPPIRNLILLCITCLKSNAKINMHFVSISRHVVNNTPGSHLFQHHLGVFYFKTHSRNCLVENTHNHLYGNVSDVDPGCLTLRFLADIEKSNNESDLLIQYYDRWACYRDQKGRHNGTKNLITLPRWSLTLWGTWRGRKCAMLLMVEKWGSRIQVEIATLLHAPEMGNVSCWQGLHYIFLCIRYNCIHYGISCECKKIEPFCTTLISNTCTEPIVCKSTL